MIENTPGTKLPSSIELHPVSQLEKGVGVEPQVETSYSHVKEGIQRERHAYYGYFAGNNGIGPFVLTNLLFQNLIQQAGFNPHVQPLGSQSCDVDATAPCHVFWNGGTKSTASVILISTAITLVGQALLFLFMGSMADYGTWAPWIVRVNTVLCFALQVAYLGVHNAPQWGTAMGLFVVSNITFWIAYIFFNALFPKLAADQPEAVNLLEQKENGEISTREYETRMQLIRSKIINRSWGWNNVGFSSGAALTVAILKGLNADASTSRNNLGYSVCVAVMAGMSLLLSIPWFVLEKRRVGRPVPNSQNIFTHGLRSLWLNLRDCAKLSQTFFYLGLYFVLADGVATLQTVVTIAQTRIVDFSAEMNSLMLVAQGASAGIFAFGAYWIQNRLSIRTKLILHISNFGCLALSIWGVAGVWTTEVGFHNLWEIWAFNALYGMSLGTQWSFGQAFMAQLIPSGLENRFFSLLGIVSKGGAWIGPLAASALIDRTGNDWSAFGIVALLIGVPSLALFFVDEDKSRAECKRFIADFEAKGHLGEGR